MKKLKAYILILLCTFTLGNHLKCQELKIDSTKLTEKDSLKAKKHNLYAFSYKKLIIHSVLIGYGIASLEIHGLKQLNLSTRYEISEHQPDKIKLDNYTQYLPAVMVYGLNWAGIKGKHNLKDRTIIYATSQLIAASMVIPLKHITKEERPDGSNLQSFPSGHTTTAFSSAQFLYREYRDTNF